MTVPSAKFTEYITNRNLTWEKTHDLNIGIDASFLNNRIDLTVDLYRTKTTDVILSQALPTSIMGNYTGSTTYKMNKNAAETENRGIELALNTRNIVKKDFTWSSTVTFNQPTKEKIKSLIEGQDMMFNAKRVIWCSKSAKESVLSIDIKCWVSGNIAKRKLLLCSDANRAILSWIYLV